jgi:uncharacterized protein (DUF1330 family)
MQWEAAVTHYVYGEICLKHAEWVEAYLREINSFVEKHDGRVLSRTIKMEKVEGNRELPTNVILVVFPTREAALGFFDDPSYQPLRKLRLDGATSEFVMFPAEDLATPPGAASGT